MSICVHSEICRARGLPLCFGLYRLSTQRTPRFRSVHMQNQILYGLATTHQNVLMAAIGTTIERIRPGRWTAVSIIVMTISFLYSRRPPPRKLAGHIERMSQTALNSMMLTV
jgi:hypothetical protein